MSDEIKELLAKALVSSIRETEPAEVDQALHQAIVLKVKELQHERAVARTQED
jgi:hypothetical protein